MKPKTVRIWYWIVTLLFAAFMAFSAITELMQLPSAQAVMVHLGYPVYLNYIIGVAKLLGAFALVQPWFRIIKEWAYAGFAIDIVGAAVSMLFVGDPFGGVLFTLLFLVVMFISYALWKKTMRMNRISPKTI